MYKWSSILVVDCVIVLTSLMVSCDSKVNIGPTESEISKFKQQGDVLIKQVEQFRIKHGRYPDSLAEANLSSPTKDYGGFNYTTQDYTARHKDGFYLSLGNNIEFRFHLFYISSVKDWGIDRD